MPRKIATSDRVDREELLEFVRPRHRATLVTTRKNGRPQLSPVTCGVDEEGRVVISTYPPAPRWPTCGATRLRRVLIHSDDWDGPFVQLDGTAEVIDLPEAVEPLVDYFRSISGEHPDWDEYRQAMREQGKSLIRVTIEGWGPSRPAASRPSWRTEAVAESTSRSSCWPPASDMPDGEEWAGTDFLLPALAERGLDARWVVWDDPDVDWSEGLVAVRSTWDYERRREEFLAWARSRAADAELARRCSPGTPTRPT